MADGCDGMTLILDTREGDAATAELVCEIRAWLARFVLLRDEHQSLTLALYVLHTYALEACGVTPYLVVLSPVRRCGKTILLEVLEELCRYGRVVSSISEAALFQMISADLSKRPTLLIDEIDAIFGRPTEQTEGLRGAINSGNRRSGRVARGGKDGTPLEYETFSCRVLAGIKTGGLPDTVRDRSVPIMLHRKEGELRLERHAAQHMKSDYDALRKRLDKWAKAHVTRLAGATPDLPDGLSDRAKDAWEPLLAIADLAGPTIASAAREAALALRDDFGESDESTHEELLRDIRDALAGRRWISTAELVRYLNGLEDRGWCSMGRDGINGRSLATMLDNFSIRPDRTARERGYSASQFAHAWKVYVPARVSENGVIPSPASQDDDDSDDDVVF